MKILILNGPNLNLLGQREPGVYGKLTLEQIKQKINELARDLGVQAGFHQTNHEGELIDILHQAQHDYNGVVFNPGAYTHYSVALRDAVAAISVPVVEVHISNIHAREEFRHHSMIAPVAAGQISGLGLNSYLLGFRAVVELAGGRGRQH